MLGVHVLFSSAPTTPQHSFMQSPVMVVPMLVPSPLTQLWFTGCAAAVVAAVSLTCTTHYPHHTLPVDRHVLLLRTIS